MIWKCSHFLNISHNLLKLCKITNFDLCLHVWFVKNTPENAKVAEKRVWCSWKCVSLVNRNVTEIVNCGSRNARCSVSKVEIISLTFKWLYIVLRSAVKTHRVLNNAFTASRNASKIQMTKKWDNSTTTCHLTAHDSLSSSIQGGVR